MDTFALRFTDVAQQSFEDQVEHLAVYQGFSSSAQRIDTLIDAIQDKLLSTPLGYPVSPQLSELGVLHYRELNADGYRIFCKRSINPTCSKTGAALSDAMRASSSTATALRNLLPSLPVAAVLMRGAATYKALGR
ncbi:type II toxin-antitoxin system RelE/ParE family toxin [Pseudomonas syringae]|uniref:type II toxin-antitoxin system RelE/ParE family toxin n=1 Tax=Pseudomonas syringae TaxID=317 RepID=UPI0026A2B6B3|nr:type II toxin-antitoxin system RelE/ParE family toxin [Pseudomonas syringae]